MERLTGLIGIFLLVGIAYSLSNNRQKISMNIVGWGLGLQIMFAIIFIKCFFFTHIFVYPIIVKESV